MNGGSSEKVIPIIRKGYMKLFVKGIIYCNSTEKYQKVHDKNKDFIFCICVNYESVISSIKGIFDGIKTNHIFDYNILMNFYTYNIQYFILHKYIADNYGNKNFPKINPKILEDNTNKDFFIKLNEFYESFKNKTNKEFIEQFLKNENIINSLNKILMKKEENDFKNIGYFVGNLMYKIVQYGKDNNKGVSSKKNFYKGMQLNMIEILEFIKYEKFEISFSQFLRVASKKELAEFYSRRNQTLLIRKDSNVFSVIINIEYPYDYKYEPCVFDLSELMHYPDEVEFIILPFTFYKVKNMKIDYIKLNVDINLEIIGRMTNLETEIQKGKKLDYDRTNNIIISI